MQTKILTLLGLAAATAVLPAQEQTGKLKFKTHKNFNFIMPKEVWTPAAGGIRTPGTNFKTRKNGVKLAVDTTGDGETNSDVKGSKGFLRFLRKDGDKKFEYAARFKGGDGVYQYSSACSLAGSIGGVPIRLFDLNNDGSFTDLGEDAIIVGKGLAATYLSKVVSHKGELFELDVAADGRSASVKPFVGKTGKLNLSTFTSKGKVESVIVSDGENAFQVARSSGLTVPVGSYRIVGGLVKKGSATANIRGGKMESLTVRENETTKLAWGGPLMAEFGYTQGGGQVTVDPKNLHYYGKSGVEFYGWAPDAKSPKFNVNDPDTGKEVGRFTLPG